MATKDAVSNASRNAARSAKEIAGENKRHEEWLRQSKRQEAVELALKMCPPDVVRSAEALMNDAEKIAAFILDGKTPAKRRK